MSWIRTDYQHWHLEDDWTPRVVEAGSVATACGQRLPRNAATFERAKHARMPTSMRCLPCARSVTQRYAKAARQANPHAANGPG
jgi:hypothetical protein